MVLVFMLILIKRKNDCKSKKLDDTKRAYQDIDLHKKQQSADMDPTKAKQWWV